MRAAGCAGASIDAMRAAEAVMLALREEADGTPMTMPPIADGAQAFPTGL